MSKLIAAARFVLVVFHFLQNRSLRRDRKSPARAIVEQQIHSNHAPVHFDPMESIKLRQIRKTNLQYPARVHGRRVARNDVRAAFTDVAAVAFAFVRDTVTPDPTESDPSAQRIPNL